MTTQPPPPPAPPPYSGGPGGYAAPQTSSKAVAALVLGIVAFVACGPFTAIPAIIVGRSAVNEIDASQGRLGGRGMATAGFILGIVGTVLAVLGLILLIVLVIVGASVGTQQGNNFVVPR